MDHRENLVDRRCLHRVIVKPHDVAFQTPPSSPDCFIVRNDHNAAINPVSWRTIRGSGTFLG